MRARDSRACLRGANWQKLLESGDEKERSRRWKRSVSGLPGSGSSALVEEEKSLLQQVFRERHRLHPAGILEMGKVGGEVKVGLKSPSVEGLKLIKERRRHSSGDVGKPGWVSCIASKQDSEKYRRLAICVGSKREADLADFARIKAAWPPQTRLLPVALGLRT